MTTDSQSQPPNGAQTLLQTLVNCGVDVCFTNPGTSEMHFLAALDQQDGMRAVLGLFEGVVTGAADGYARMAGKPACTLLHLGPGLANGLANLHNARRANSPIVNVVGEHATYHRALDAPLTSNIAGFAEPVSGWIHMSQTAAAVAADGAAAVQAALAGAGQIATLILPADTAWDHAQGAAHPLPPATAPVVTPERIQAVTEILLAADPAEPCLLLCNGAAVSAEGLALLGQIAAKTGAQVMGDTFISRIERGAGRFDIPRLPYFAEQAEAVLQPFRHIILVDTKAPVSFFAYPGKASELTPAHAQAHVFSEAGDATLDALAQLCDAVGASTTSAPLVQLERPALPTGALTPESIAQSVAALLPEHAIVVNEAATAGFAMPEYTRTAPPHSWLDLTGGAIGMGLPAATGAAIACPDRQVVSLQADGSGMYTVQALWTQAREELDVTTIIFSNRKYAILQVEFMRVGATNPGRKAMDMMELNRPDLDWVAMAQGMGVTATRAVTADELNTALAEALANPGPNLIEAVV
ncbi:MAG: acetolactate synthase large subunit [Pseudomonadota bacterium]